MPSIRVKKIIIEVKYKKKISRKLITLKTSNDFFLGHDLAMLSLANISVLTYGTFGLWGAFLGNAEEIIVSQHMFTETKEGYELKEANLSNVVVL